METGLGGARRRRVCSPVAVLRRNAVAIAAGVLIAAASAGVAGTITASAHWHSWQDVQAAVTGTPPMDPAPAANAPAHAGASTASGITVAAAALAGLVATLALMLLMVIVSFSAFFLLGLPALLGLIGAGALWGVQAGFGGAAPLEPWLAGAGGIALLSLAAHTGAPLPLSWSPLFCPRRHLYLLPAP